MRYLILILCIVPLKSFGQWSFDAFYKDNDTSATLIFPIDYSSSNCLFNFDVLENNLQEPVIIDNKGCDDHWLVIDSYVYQLPTFNYQYSPVNPDQHLISGAVQLGVCSRISNNPITVSDPGLKVGGQVFGLNTNQIFSVFNWNGGTYFQFSSFDGDIYCTNGTLFDLIFRSDFE